MRCIRWCICILCLCVASILIIQVHLQLHDTHTHTHSHRSLSLTISSDIADTGHKFTALQEELKRSEEKKFTADEKYMNYLGFRNKGTEEDWHNTSVPAIVSYATDDRHFQAVGLIRNVASKLPNHTLILYDVGAKKKLSSLTNLNCNSTKCMIVNFDLDVFPSHISEEKLHAYRPLIIQDALSKVGAVIFTESDHRFIGETNKITDLYNTALDGIGIIAWPTRPAVSSLTHPKMFDYFHTFADNFLFLPMVEVVHLVIVKSASITDHIMMPWVQCALTQDCIFPIGAQSDGCRFDKKPQYRYSGCHNYDASALSIVLGLRYNLDDSHYTYRGSDTLFKKVSYEEAYQEYLQLEKNSTVAPREESETIP